MKIDKRYIREDRGMKEELERLTGLVGNMEVRDPEGKERLIREKKDLEKKVDSMTTERERERERTE